MTRAFIGLGSNMGDARGNVHNAFARLAESPQVLAARLSTLYRSAPIGYIDQDWFVNGVAALDVDIDCYDLFKLCKQVEQDMKRVRDRRWGPRIIDLDIIWMDGFFVDEDDLQIPHPRAHERAFVLKPLVELDPTIAFKERQAMDWLNNCAAQELEVCL